MLQRKRKAAPSPSPSPSSSSSSSCPAMMLHLIRQALIMSFSVHLWECPRSAAGADDHHGCMCLQTDLSPVKLARNLEEIKTERQTLSVLSVHRPAEPRSPEQLGPGAPAPPPRDGSRSEGETELCSHQETRRPPVGTKYIFTTSFPTKRCQNKAVPWHMLKKRILHMAGISSVCVVSSFAQRSRVVRG
ncbi:hypothetical protein NQZ68_039106 [Dissostichus eleginoides]|nr:hypothetical protein NQZ68_039106 [Dissostichus eleginoides]